MDTCEDADGIIDTAGSVNAMMEQLELYFEQSRAETAQRMERLRALEAQQGETISKLIHLSSQASSQNPSPPMSNDRNRIAGHHTVGINHTPIASSESVRSEAVRAEENEPAQPKKQTRTHSKNQKRKKNLYGSI